jgi:hypothetical protein
MKIIKVENCSDCPNHRQDMKGHYCYDNEQEIIKVDAFPDWCPLEEAPDAG